MVYNISDLFDVMADILVDTISNEANIMLNIKIDCRFNESNHYFKMLYPYLNNSTFNADEINKIIDDILMQDIYTRLLFIQAIDLINPFEMVYNSYMRNTLDESKVLNSRHTDKILFFPKFKNIISHKHSINNSIASMFSNICYVYVSDKYSIQNHYFFDNFENGKKYKIGLIPLDSELQREYDETILNEKKYYVPKKCFKDNKMIDMEYIYNEISYLIEVGVNMIIMPETLEPLDNERLVNVVKKSNVIIYGPAYYDFTNEGVYSIAKVHSREILPKEEFDVMKILPYVSRYDENNKTAKMEKINPGDILHILHIKNYGKILLMICSDAFNDYAKQVISTMDIDLIAISSCTDSYYAFDTTYMEEIKQKNRALIQCNLCSNCFVAKRKINQVNYLSKGKNNEEKITCDVPCKRMCSKHFVFDVDISDKNKCLIEEVKNEKN